MNEKNFKITLIIFLTLSFLGVYWSFKLVFKPILYQESGDGVKVSFLDVGQGDATFFEINGKFVLIDAGKGVKAYEKVEDILDGRGIYLAVITHPDSDHSDGFKYIANRISVENVLISSYDSNSSKYKDILNSFKNKKSKVFVLENRKEININGARFSILWPLTSNIKNSNNASIVSLFSYGDIDIFLGGDISSRIEDELLKIYQNYLSDVEILKASHHGSKHSTSLELLYKLNPKAIIYSASLTNPYGHPSGDVIDRVEEYRKSQTEKITEHYTYDGDVVFCLTKKEFYKC